ncbi:hypothetical protein HAX54_048197 [Datura stramonium]|uniref:Pectinesterase inhibitor domain-containing protein n=1 Tax=Datura stramonium TaxID=4076 RepID=A0ABS8Y8K1_DATST|nr:hypothetical protein [Datura stramonium]
MSLRNLFCGVIVVLLCSISCPLVSCRPEDFFQSECLKVPASEFVGSVKSTIDTVRQVTSIVSKFASFFGDFRLSNAISDCLDLLELSADELTWTLTASQNPKGISIYLLLYH